MELQMESKTTQVTKRPVHITGIAGGFEPRLCSLEQALAYRDDQILYKFQERWDVSFEEASELFEETKKWLWLQVAARKQPGSPPMAMTVSLAMVDEMLHTFILFTREYIQYCDKNYGVYLHHAPMTKKAKDAQMERFKKDRTDARDRSRVLVEYVFTCLRNAWRRDGGEVVLEYPKKYSGARMAS